MKCKIMFKQGGVPDSRFNRRQLDLGARVEREHTNNPCLAKQIAKAHLVENANYYKMLKQMETKMRRR